MLSRLRALRNLVRELLQRRSAKRLIGRYGPQLAAQLNLTQSFTIISFVVGIAAIVTGFPIWPAVVLSLVIHLFMSPRLFETYQAMADLEQLREALYHASITDYLTGVANRRYFTEALEQQAQAELQPPSALMLIDADHFKQINDSYGHHGGDEVLRIIAQRGTAIAGERGLFARFGGEEFALLLTDLGEAEARLRAEELRSSIANQPVLLQDGRAVSVTVSVGFVFAPNGIRQTDRALVLADHALYAAKHSGRNQVVAATFLGDL